MKQLTSLGVNIDRCTIKDVYQFEMHGLVPDTSKSTISKNIERFVGYSEIELDYNDTLNSTNKKFWVGVKPGQYNSDPISRRSTNCFSARDCLELNGEQLIFSMLCEDGHQHWFYVPENEMNFVQSM